MKFLASRKGFIMHPFFLAGVALVLGFLVMYLIAKGVIPLPGFLAWLKP